MTLIIHQTPSAIIQEFGGDSKVNKYIREQIRKANCWGFIQDCKEIHLYYNNQTTKRNLLELMAHEITHSGYQDLKSGKYNEEKYCTVIAAIAVRAYDLTKRLL